MYVESPPHAGYVKDMGMDKMATGFSTAYWPQLSQILTNVQKPSAANGPNKPYTKITRYIH